MIYSRDRIEYLIPGVWDEHRILEARNEYAPDPSMPKAKQYDPRRSTDLVTEVADIQQAWKKASISHEQRQAVLLRFALDMTYEEVGLQLGVTSVAALKRCDRGIDNLGEFLNGRSFPPRQDATTDS